MTGQKENEVRKRAYEMWERDGRPHGRDMEYWLAAEQAMHAEAAAPNTQRGRAATRATKTTRSPARATKAAAKGLKAPGKK